MFRSPYSLLELERWLDLRLDLLLLFSGFYSSDNSSCSYNGMVSNRLWKCFTSFILPSPSSDSSGCYSRGLEARESIRSKISDDEDGWCGFELIVCGMWWLFCGSGWWLITSSSSSFSSTILWIWFSCLVTLLITVLRYCIYLVQLSN